MGALIRVLKAVDRVIAALELTVSISSLALILVLTTIPIVLRVLHGNSAAFWWTTPASLYLLLTSTFFGASVAIRSRRNRTFVLVTRALPRRAKAGFGVVGGLVAAAILGTLAFAAVHYVRANWEQASKLRGVKIGPIHVPDLPLGPLQIAMPIALAVMTFRCVVGALEDLRGVVTGDLAYLAAYEHLEGADLAGGHQTVPPAPVEAPPGSDLPPPPPPPIPPPGPRPPPSGPGDDPS